MSELADLVSAFASLAWPILFAVFLFLLRNEFQDILSSIRKRKFSIKIGGSELTLEEWNEQQKEFITDLHSELMRLKKRVEGASNSGLIQEKETKTIQSILWVDDKDKNKSYIREILTQYGITIVKSSSTTDAVSKFDKGSFDFVISNMSRTEEGVLHEKAGIELAKRIRILDKSVPMVIYCGQRRAAKYNTEARDAGANLVTTSSTEVMEALGLSHLYIPD